MNPITNSASPNDYGILFLDSAANSYFLSANSKPATISHPLNAHSSLHTAQTTYFHHSPKFKFHH